MQNQHNPVNPHIASIVDCLLRLPEDQLVSWNSKITGASVPYMTHSAPLQPPQDDTAEPEPTDPAEAVEAQEAPHELVDDVPPLTKLETKVLHFLKCAAIGPDGLPLAYSGEEIAHHLGCSYNYLSGFLGPSGELRRRGLITHRRNVGYRIAIHLTTRPTGG